MGLQQLVKDAVVMAFDVIADLEKVTFNYKESDPSYNETTGVVTDTESSCPVKMIISRWNAKQIDNLSILPTDMKAIMPVSKLSVTPNRHCTVTRNGIELDIEDIQTDPMEGAWIFQLRQP
jgi:hypothetical protein